MDTLNVKMKLIVFAIDLICPLVLGYACKYQHRFGDDFFNKMILNNIMIVCPVVSFLAFWIMPLTRELLLLPVLSLAMMAVPGAIGFFAARRKYVGSFGEQGAFVMAACLSNIGAIGGVCVFLIYGEQGYGYQQIAVLVQYIFMFMICYPLAQWYEANENGRSAKKVSIISMIFTKKQLAVLGILAGGLLQLAGIARPHELDGVAELFIHAGAWTGLIPVGYSIDFPKVRKYAFSLFDMAFIKFIATPLLMCGLTALSGVSHTMAGTIIVLSAMPTAINAVVTARLYRLNIDLDVASFLITTLIFIFAVYPVMFILLTR